VAVLHKSPCFVSFTRYVQPPMISFEAIFEQSTPNSPIVFILSPGSDPASDLMKLAERSGFGGNRLKFLAMGQGQEKVICCWKERTLNLGEVPAPVNSWLVSGFEGAAPRESWVHFRSSGQCAPVPGCPDGA